MALFVEKFGGTSVGTVERIHAVADRVVRSRRSGNDVVVVVSAMAGETDRLLSLAQEIQSRADSATAGPMGHDAGQVKATGREIDTLLATGEQVTIALLVLALQGQSVEALSYTGSQVPIRTDSVHGKARILDIDPTQVRADLDAGYVVVIAGFQGGDTDGNITT